MEVCLCSLKNQVFQDFEIIVVDNGSSDGSAGFIKKEYPEIVVECFKENRGFVRAVNRGIEMSEGEYIFLLNNDTELDKNCLFAADKFLEKNKDVAICATKMLYFDNHSVINDVGDNFSVYGIASQRDKGEVDKGQYNKQEEIFGACAGAAFYRREVFRKIGLFDEDFFAYLEDVDIAFRAQLAGFKCVFLPEAIVYHVDGGTSRKINNFSRFYTLRNSLYVIVKNMPMILLFKFFPYILLGQIRNFFMGIKHRCLGLIFCVYFDFLKNFLNLLRKRKDIQKNKIVSNKYLINIISRQYPFSVVKSIKEMLNK